MASVTCYLLVILAFEDVGVWHVARVMRFEGSARGCLRLDCEMMMKKCVRELPERLCAQDEDGLLTTAGF